jgi:hypothetical protein
MHFFDDSLLPENQEKLVIQVAPYGPEWLPSDSDDIPVSMDKQVQKAGVCQETMLHRVGFCGLLSGRVVGPDNSRINRFAARRKT